MMKIEGRARLGKKTKDLVKRLKPGDIAIIDHIDIDRVSAESLVETGVEAVINAAPSISGKYPNMGPIILLSSGINLMDKVDNAFDLVKEGDKISIKDSCLWRGREKLFDGSMLTLNEVAQKMDDSRSMIGEELEKFAANTMEYMLKEKDLLYGNREFPDLKTRINGRHVLVVVRGHGYKDDLATLRSYISEIKPVLIGVDGGADALVSEGFKPDIIVGDMDSVSNDTLNCGAELIVHAYSDGRCPGMKRLEKMELKASPFPSEGTSEDIALLMAFEKNAELIVAVGSHVNLVEFLDKGRSGMSSTFLTRLKVGEILVDAKGVNKLYRSSVKLSHLMVLSMAALLTISIIIFVSPPLRRILLLTLLKLKVTLGI